MSKVSKFTFSQLSGEEMWNEAYTAGCNDGIYIMNHPHLGHEDDNIYTGRKIRDAVIMIDLDHKLVEYCKSKKLGRILYPGCTYYTVYYQEIMPDHIHTCSGQFAFIKSFHAVLLNYGIFT